MTEPRVHREIERKLEVPARFRVPVLGGAGSGIGARLPQPTLLLTAVYFDTADLRLARHQITLRRRTGGIDDGWHLKLPHADEATRDEIRLPLATPGKPPSALAELVLGVTRGAPLQAVATLRTQRRPLVLLDEHGAGLAELTDDRVSVTVAGKVTSRFRELEVEAADGRRVADLDAVIAALIAAGATESGFASKAVRALGPRAVEPPDIVWRDDLRPRDPAGEVLQAFIARCAHAMVTEDLRVRRGFPDAVHQLRVAARRLRSGLKVFAPLVDPEWAGELSGQLAWIAGELGAARDIEVLESRLLAGLGAIDDNGAASAANVVRRSLERDEEQALLRVIAAMRSARYLALLDDLVDAARSPRLTVPPAAPARAALPPLMGVAWRRLARDVKALRKDGPDETWHAARIRAKRARYAAEALIPAFGKPAKQLAQKLEVVTELLGRHQDAAIAAEMALVLAGGHRVRSQAVDAFALLHDAQRAEVRAVRRRFAKVWPRVAQPRWRRWLRPAQ